jgi:plastocyanin
VSFQSGRTKRSISKFSAAGILVGVLAVAGCGSSSSNSSSSATTAAPAATATTPTTTAPGPATSGSTQALALAANPEGQLKYSTTSLTAKAGSVAIAFANSSPVGHNMTIESSSGATVGATPTFQGGVKTLKLNLKPGTYKFFCSVPGHRQAGMEGTLTVN